MATTPEMDALIAQAKANTDAEAAAVGVMNTLAAALVTAAGNKQATLDLAASLKTSADAIGAAIVADTPAA
jgi:hypothetical protein